MKNNQVMKICSFYVNEWHLTTMLLPYINKRIQEDKNITTMLEQGIQNKVEELLSKMNLAQDSQEAILKISWTSQPILKYSEVKSWIEEKIANYGSFDIIINGTMAYMDNVNKSLEKAIKTIGDLPQTTSIRIINCYDVGQYTEVSNILEQHDKLLNTSGIREIEEVFTKEENLDIAGLAN